MTASPNKMSHADRRIARNTVFLCGRMLVIMAISVYTSRVILEALGIDDFGIYNLIAGIIVLFSFLSNALLASCQRYLSVAVGMNDMRHLQRTFATALAIHVAMAVVIALLTEALGLWLLDNSLNIPPERMEATQWVFQLMVLSMVFQVIRIPYTAAVISHERMDIFAYIGLVEAVLKLLIVFMLWIAPFDKLIYYSWLTVGVNVVILLWFMVIARFSLARYRLSIKGDTRLALEMMSFTGWNLLGGVADVAYKQGTSIILNIFYGVALNATMGIVNQVRMAVASFTANLQTAANPQIIKRFSMNDMSGFTSLVFSISKFSAMLMLLVALPLIANMDFILSIWLVKIPPYAGSFCILMLVFCIIDALHGPLWTAMEATGHIRKTQIWVSVVLLLNLPLTWAAFALDCAPESMIVIQIAVTAFTLVVRMRCLRPISPLRRGPYFTHVLLPLAGVVLLGSAATAAVMVFMDNGWLRLFGGGAAIFLITALASYFCGCSVKERAIINEKLLSVLHRKGAGDSAERSEP